jgi:transporter family-2 protein
MTDTLILILVAVVGGTAITVQGQLMGLIDQSMGTKASVFITYASGGLLVSLWMLFSGGGNLRAWQTVPWYAFSAGAWGLVIVGTISYVVPRLGLVIGFTVIVASQFIVAALIDHFGLLGATSRPLEWSRLLGLILLLIGIWLIIR